jgi:hypothetical protein
MLTAFSYRNWKKLIDPWMLRNEIRIRPARQCACSKASSQRKRLAQFTREADPLPCPSASQSFADSYQLFELSFVEKEVCAGLETQLAESG